ncbi:MAG: S41 family peptidase [Patescibacteria group bacterium]
MTINSENFNTLKTSSRKSRPSTLTVIFIAVAFLIGLFLGQYQTESGIDLGRLVNINKEKPAGLSQDVDFSLFWKVWDYVQANYLEHPVSDTKLFYGSLQGILASLGDPYSIFMDPETADKFNQELSGNFEGIGAEIGLKNDHLVIIAPLPGTPAERAGLRPGDRILSINDLDTTGIALDYAVSLIKGPKNTKVVLKILSNGDQESRNLEIIRDQIKVDVIRSELKTVPGTNNQVGYIRLIHFARETNDSFVKSWQNLSARGASGLILDLRNNPGGYLDQAVDIASHWIKEGVVVKEQFVPPQFKEYKSTGIGNLRGIPTVVLINQGSASASEIVAGALQDYGLATLVGEKTFGKGSVQDYQTFPDRSSLKLTVAKWFTPKGRQIDKTGIKPDVEIIMTKEDYNNDTDPQLDKALELLGK